MPRISVVVPIYDVEPYLAECLQSLADQTVSDLEIVLVDDGSGDGSAAVAESFVARDARFRLITQANGGLGRARNTGADASSGEFLAFVDSDDVVVGDAYEKLLGSLEQTGSDFATGNVRRLSRLGTRQAPFLAKTFTRTRPKTHVREFRALLVDRIAPNKLWRRSFWDEHRLRFPEGVVHEDIPVVVPAHFLARSVDVIADPVYLYREREGEDRSITQRRVEQRVLLDRIAAVQHVRDFLAEHEPRKARRWYDESIVAEDLRYYLNVLDAADEDYRALFLDRVNALLDRVDRRAFDPLPAIERLKWLLARRRLMPELLETIRFQREELAERPPLRRGRRLYGDYPFRTDRRLRIPADTYRLGGELKLAAQVERLRFDGGRLHVDGWTFIGGAGAPTRRSQRVVVSAVRSGRLAGVRLRLAGLRVPVPFAGVRLRTAPVHRPDVTSMADEGWSQTEWSGLTASLDPRRLRPGTWELSIVVRAAGLKRRRSRFSVDGNDPVRPVELPRRGGAVVRAYRTPAGGVVVDVRESWAVVRGHLGGDGVVELHGDLGGAGGGELRLEVSHPDGERAMRVPLRVEGGAFRARVPLSKLPALGEAPGAEAADDSGNLGDVAWELWAVGGGRRVRVSLAADAADGAWPVAGGEVALTRTLQGEAALVRRPRSALLREARWGDDGTLELAGWLGAVGTDGEAAAPGAPGPAGAAGAATQLVLVAQDRFAEHAFPIRVEAGRFVATLAPPRIPSLDGPLPLGRGIWALVVRRSGADDAPVMLERALAERLPQTAVVDHKPFALATGRSDRAVLVVRRDHEPDERGPYHRRRLREASYAARRSEPLVEAVVYTSFGGRQCSDSPRAIHRELVRRAAPLEHLWVVRDGMARVPEGAGVLREGSREHHEALATARFVVTNDDLPTWFERRSDQVCLQTGHGAPLKRIGFDVPDVRTSVPRTVHRARQVASWQYVVSPSRFATPILRDAYEIEGDVLETGLPRTDVLAGAGAGAATARDAATRRVRERLGVGEHTRVMLYAPTFRDQLADGQGRQRLDLRLDAARLRGALGDDAVLLVRPHPYVVDAVPGATADGFVRDASRYPDGTELLLAADVLVTDYSSAIFDFASTDRPMLFFAYDLDAYRDEIRGFAFDVEDRLPGPLLRTTDALADALRDIDAVAAEHADRRRAFAAAFCELDDGAATARVVERVFGR